MRNAGAQARPDDAAPAQGRPRRQWGADERVVLPPVSTPASNAEIATGRLAIAFVVVAWLVYVSTTVLGGLVNRSFRGRPEYLIETLAYVAISSLLGLSCLMYLIARQGALYRTRAHRRAPRAVAEDAVAAAAPRLTVLVPSYEEEISTVRMTLLSAALQEHPSLRVVLLLDDPPYPTDPERAATLAATRALAADLTAWLAEPRQRFERLVEELELERVVETPDAELAARLAREYRWAADWLHARADVEEPTDHVEDFFVEHVLRALADDLASVSDALLAAGAAGTAPTPHRLRQLQRRLLWTFSAEITWFERKTYASLSHDANKAMNLNSYLGLMGRSFRVEQTPAGRVLVPATGPDAVTIPDADFVLTLDADSVVLPEYCLRLVHVMLQPESSRLAIVQTPYSAIPGAATRLERLAGATTDVQHLVHQGMSYHGATFWVGANAVIRKRALDDIVEVEEVGGHTIRRYIMDRTVIEDTESTLDLVAHGWELRNYPERLSYSATPPDFGALCIQRRRWANGGLLILPRLHGVRRAREARGEPGSVLRTLLRLNYLASTCWASLALFALLFFPFDSRLLHPLVLAVAAPYFLMMAVDLHRCGYQRRDLLRVYGLNLILLPVNLAGVLKSLQQGITGRRIPFARTPKVADRTATPLLFALSPLLIIGYSVLIAWRDAQLGNWGNAAFATFNALTASYALVALMGLRATATDIGLGVVEALRAPQPRAPQERSRRRADAAAPAEPAWEDVLYRGAPGTASGTHPVAITGPFRVQARAASPRPLGPDAGAEPDAEPDALANA